MTEKCKTCGKEYSTSCTYHQGRCEHPLAKAPLAPPDPMLHRNISFVKSIMRVVAGALLINNRVVAAGVMIILAEILGVVEEVV
jgi:hypothetical protein